ncbi:MAG: LysR family transcriptional regulator [Coriobacteriales bacterium]|jgi:DNA-binding transcriptional LysR family regulator
MELKNILTVKKIVETGSFQKAARELNYAQSTISFQVRRLESELGVHLFERQGQIMRLTQQGQELMPAFDGVLAAVDQVEQTAARSKKPQGLLRVCAPESLVTYRLQPVLAEFKRAAPEVNLRLAVENCYDIYDRLLTGGVDIAIHYDVADYPEGYEAVQLGTFPLVLVGSPGLTERDRDFVTARQKKTICHISNDPKALYLRIWKSYLTERAITLAPEMEVWSIEAVKRCVESGLGVAYLPRFTVEEELKSGSLIEIPTDLAGASMKALCVRDARRWESPAASLFWQLLIDSMPLSQESSRARKKQQKRHVSSQR